VIIIEGEGLLEIVCNRKLLYLLEGVSFNFSINLSFAAYAYGNVIFILDHCKKGILVATTKCKNREDDEKT
jgi:hypothetical protein